jgi:hypothetical protein
MEFHKVKQDVHDDREELYVAHTTDMFLIHGELYRCVPEGHLDALIVEHVLDRVLNKPLRETHVDKLLVIPPVFGIDIYNLIQYHGVIHCKCGYEPMSMAGLLQGNNSMMDTMAGIVYFSLSRLNSGEVEGYRRCSDSEILVYHLVKYTNAFAHIRNLLGLPPIMSLALDADRLDKIDDMNI